MSQETTVTVNKSIIRLERVFRMGSIELADPAPDEPPTAALKLYELNYPHLATATLAEPVVEGDRLVFEIQKPVVQTKG